MADAASGLLLPVMAQRAISGMATAPDSDNLTPFGLDTAYTYDVHGRSMVVTCVAARYRMPVGGRAFDGPLALADAQPPPAMADVHWADPATSSLRLSGQGLTQRPTSEIYLCGHARAPRGRAVAQLRASVQVGECRKQIDVTGDRTWLRGIVGPRAGRPTPFERMPLVYERAFGGRRVEDGRVVAAEPRNPVGVGLHASAAVAVGCRLPNLEVPGSRVGNWNDRVEVAGFGPIPASWQPRLAHAGTYDQRWVDERAPLWPEDIGAAFFGAAAAGLSAPRPLQGGEPVVLQGFSPDGAITFRLPQLRLIAKHYRGDGTRRGPLTLDAVLLEPDADAVTLFWRCAVPLGYGPTAHLRTVVRTLESWEELAGG